MTVVILFKVHISKLKIVLERISASVPPGAAAAVGVAALHRPGAEDGVGEASVQTQGPPWGPADLQQLPQPLRPPAQGRQVTLDDPGFILRSNVLEVSMFYFVS